MGEEGGHTGGDLNTWATKRRQTISWLSTAINLSVDVILTRDSEIFTCVFATLITAELMLHKEFTI
jgi:hypothetical protein